MWRDDLVAVPDEGEAVETAISRRSNEMKAKVAKVRLPVAAIVFFLLQGAADACLIHTHAQFAVVFVLL